MQKTSRLVTLSFGALLLVTLVVPVSIGSPVTSVNMPAAQEASAKPITINGTVSAVSETSVTVVDSKKVEQVITIDASTKITKGGKDETEADITGNDDV